MTENVPDERATRSEPADEREKIERLHGIAAEMMTCRTEREVYQLTVGAAERILAFDICGVDAVEDGWLVPKAVSAEMADVGYKRSRIEEGGLAGEAYRTGESIVTDDVTAAEGAEPATDEYRSGLTVPVGDLGVFQAGAREPGAFDESDRELAELLLAHTEEALRRIRFESALRERNRTIEQLHESARELIAADDATEVCELAVEAARETLGLEICGVHLAEEGALAPVAWTTVAGSLFGGEPPTYGPGQTPIWQAYEAGTQAVQAVEEVASDESDVVVTVALVVPLGERGVFVAGAPDAEQFSEQVIDLAGVLAATVETALDRTERERELRERERELKRQNERLEEFASVVSHDLRNPLAVAQGNLQLARETGDEAFFEKVAAAHERMEGLVEDLLALARGGQVVGEHEPVGIAEAAERAWKNVEAPTATLTVEGDGDAEADADRLVQLLANLFRNAVEHGSRSPQQAGDAVEHGSTSPPSQAQEDAVEHGEADVHVVVEVTEQGFAVTDDGVGIPAEARDEVLAYGYSTDDEGTGLGLAIVREIAEAHGWTVRVGESDRGGARIDVVTG